MEQAHPSGRGCAGVLRHLLCGGQPARRRRRVARGSGVRRCQRRGCLWHGPGQPALCVRRDCAAACHRQPGRRGRRHLACCRSGRTPVRHAAATVAILGCARVAHIMGTAGAAAFRRIHARRRTQPCSARGSARCQRASLFARGDGALHALTRCVRDRRLRALWCASCRRQRSCCARRRACPRCFALLLDQPVLLRLCPERR